MIPQHFTQGLRLAACGAKEELVSTYHACSSSFYFFVLERSRWVLMSFSAMSALTAPTEATENDDDHSVGR
ncbi:hypothetical protein OG331_06330 [Streptomyces sp. NBC_01017]|uniref:hypothetical protein n=1 Tax=Streptomyces sp. NBC_01017 TaxID=2903721 RepID=UPI003863C340|nr:hypothetical protein OG331_06330 [Streptomyces sp. NBC_01017]